MRAEFKSNGNTEVIDLGDDTDFVGITCLDCNVNMFLDCVFDDINFKVLNFKVFDNVDVEFKLYTFPEKYCIRQAFVPYKGMKFYELSRGDISLTVTL